MTFEGKAKWCSSCISFCTSSGKNSVSFSCQSKQVSRCCINFPHELTCQILTIQGINIGRGAWPTRDYGEKSEKHLFSLLAFLITGWIFASEVSLTSNCKIVLVHGDINTTYFIWILKNKLEPTIIWKLVTCQQIPSKKTRPGWVNT